ncbi:uncharacterized protein BXZ73DRAFT_83590 [Epithele typhae]|uniref:uncharacterized protein n=1 Tax=Epithele typhae TaxID=378194 RepID=UPI00200881A7|nr:uncharacterized protein BXZ73DRAFT_83590 [Epithele typhae]KAH9910427.1 hypothetical protein BXZ73DRAFT_83590 [Epithele typhae]
MPEATPPVERIRQFASTIHHLCENRPDQQSSRQEILREWESFMLGCVVELGALLVDAGPVIDSLPCWALGAITEYARSQEDTAYSPSPFHIIRILGAQEGRAFVGRDDGPLGVLPLEQITVDWAPEGAPFPTIPAAASHAPPAIAFVSRRLSPNLSHGSGGSVGGMPNERAMRQGRAPSSHAAGQPEIGSASSRPEYGTNDAKHHGESRGSPPSAREASPMATPLSGTAPKKRARDETAGAGRTKKPHEVTGSSTPGPSGLRELARRSANSRGKRAIRLPPLSLQNMATTRTKGHGWSAPAAGVRPASPASRGASGRVNSSAGSSPSSSSSRPSNSPPGIATPPPPEAPSIASAQSRGGKRPFVPPEAGIPEFPLQLTTKYPIGRMPYHPQDRVDRRCGSCKLFGKQCEFYPLDRKATCLVCLKKHLPCELNAISGGTAGDTGRYKMLRYGIKAANPKVYGLWPVEVSDQLWGMKRADIPSWGADVIAFWNDKRKRDRAIAQGDVIGLKYPRDFRRRLGDVTMSEGELSKDHPAYMAHRRRSGAAVKKDNGAEFPSSSAGGSSGYSTPTDDQRPPKRARMRPPMALSSHGSPGATPPSVEPTGAAVDMEADPSPGSVEGASNTVTHRRPINPAFAPAHPGSAPQWGFEQLEARLTALESRVQGWMHRLEACGRARDERIDGLEVDIRAMIRPSTLSPMTCSPPWRNGGAVAAGPREPQCFWDMSQICTVGEREGGSFWRERQWWRQGASCSKIDWLRRRFYYRTESRPARPRSEPAVLSQQAAPVTGLAWNGLAASAGAELAE